MGLSVPTLRAVKKKNPNSSHPQQLNTPKTLNEGKAAAWRGGLHLSRLYRGDYKQYGLKEIKRLCKESVWGYLYHAEHVTEINFLLEKDLVIRPICHLVLFAT